jgi:predicted ATPase
MEVISSRSLPPTWRLAPDSTEGDLLLDNCEHVIAGVAALVSMPLPACAGLHVLATSREPLRVRGEVERAVLPIDRPDPEVLESPDRLAEYDAVGLLVERAEAVAVALPSGRTTPLR